VVITVKSVFLYFLSRLSDPNLMGCLAFARSINQET